MVRAMTDIDTKIDDTAPKGERIAKALARAGIASRRDVERMIEAGRIKLNGKTLETPATLITSLDGILVDGNPVESAPETKLWRMHKRRGCLTTHKDPEGRPTVFDNLAGHMGRVIAIGRLDMNTEGLLLLTNDGELARWLELPEHGFVRRYKVRAHGYVREAELKKLANGVTIDGINYGEIDAKLDSQNGANAWISIAIKEGKNREVRKVMEHLGLEVNRLLRISYGPFTLGTLQRDAVAGVSRHQLIDVLPGFFEGRKGSVAAPTSKALDKSKWAKAKPKDTKPGDKRRKKSPSDDQRAPREDHKGVTGGTDKRGNDPVRRPARRGIAGGMIGDYKPRKKRNPGNS